MITISDALPIQFWPIGVSTYNETTFGFIDHRCYNQEFACADTIKLQLIDTEYNSYSLHVRDEAENLIANLGFTKTAFSGYNAFNLSFNANDEGFCDQSVRFYIAQNDGSLDSGTFDPNTMDVSGTGEEIYKSDWIKFNSSIALTPGWGTKFIEYKSNKNFVGISYPNDGNYFGLRIPCRFYQQRNPTEQNSLVLSNSKVINTALTMKVQQLMTTILLPDYIHNKLQLIFAHASRGSVMIDGVEWTIEEAYERSSPDTKSSFQTGNIWLTRKNYYVRNII
ncbi:MAG TPA: hypothetical protein VL443_29915 [Cyclobacteriaceae bacterium]|nr:hypothetical protein [Cyclobacteriaceae bacterium]